MRGVKGLPIHRVHDEWSGRGRCKDYKVLPGVMDHASCQMTGMNLCKLNSQGCLLPTLIARGLRLSAVK